MKNKDLDPTPQEWAELKKNLPKFIKEGIQICYNYGDITDVCCFCYSADNQVVTYYIVENFNKTCVIKY